MLKDIDESRAEVFRRSEERIKDRKKLLIRILTTCTLIAVCLTVIFVFVLKENKWNGMAGNPNDHRAEDTGQDFAALLEDLRPSGYAGLENPENPDVVLPPAVVGETQAMEARYSIRYSFQEAYDAAGAVAIIEIGNWLGESEYYFCSYYEAKPVAVYKGELPDSFVFSQCGYSGCTFEHFPLPTYGERRLVFLVSNVQKEYEFYDFKYALADQMTTCFVRNDSEGNEYILDWNGYVGEGLGKLKNYVGVPEIYSQFRDDEYIKDYIFGDSDRGFLAVIREEDFAKAVSGMAGK